MLIGIDASNISSGGGLTHLIELLSSIPDNFLIENTIYVWGSSKTLSHIPKRTGIFLETQKLLNKNLLCRFFWQILILSKISKKCDILFIPGSLFIGNFKPYVTMVQNLLPFDHIERSRFKYSTTFFRYVLLEKLQSETFNKSSGIIHLTNYVKEFIQVGKNIESKVIPHGISNIFYINPRVQKIISEYSENNPFRLTYVSIINLYKHQDKVAAAVSMLRAKGYPVVIDFIGNHYKPALIKFNKTIKNLDNSENFIRYLGKIPYYELPEYYKKTDLFIFASTCETFGQIILEAMAAGLPIACSNRTAMPEILGDAGLYFNPENEIEIANTIEKLIINQKLREELAYKAYMKAKEFSWRKCADETFSFLIDVAKKYPKEK